MKTFHQFLLEMKDPVGSAQKYARRQMARDAKDPSVPPVTEYEDEQRDPGERLYIRTRGFDRNKAVKVLDNLLKREDRIIGKRSWSEGKPLIDAREVKRTLSVRRLLPTQDTVDVGNAETLKKKMEYNPQTMKDRVRVVRSGRKNYIVDGHHRVLGAILAKKKTIPVRLFNLDAPKKKKEKKNAK